MSKNYRARKDNISNQLTQTCIVIIVFARTVAITAFTHGLHVIKLARTVVTWTQAPASLTINLNCEIIQSNENHDARNGTSVHDCPSLSGNKGK